MITDRTDALLHYDGNAWEMVSLQLEAGLVTGNYRIWGRAQDDIYLASW